MLRTISNTVKLDHSARRCDRHTSEDFRLILRKLYEEALAFFPSFLKRSAKERRSFFQHGLMNAEVFLIADDSNSYCDEPAAETVLTSIVSQLHSRSSAHRWRLVGRSSAMRMLL